MWSLKRAYTDSESLHSITARSNCWSIPVKLYGCCRPTQRVSKFRVVVPQLAQVANRRVKTCRWRIAFTIDTLVGRPQVIVNQPFAAHSTGYIDFFGITIQVHRTELESFFDCIDAYSIGGRTPGLFAGGTVITVIEDNTKNARRLYRAR